jgi:hypothetical protein
MVVCGQLHSPAALPTGNRPGTHCIGGWMGPRSGLDGCEKSRPHRDSIPGPSSPNYSGAGVKRQAGEKGSTACPSPSVFCTFENFHSGRDCEFVLNGLSVIERSTKLPDRSKVSDLSTAAQHLL